MKRIQIFKGRELSKKQRKIKNEKIFFMERQRKRKGVKNSKDRVK